MNQELSKFPCICGHNNLHNFQYPDIAEDRNFYCDYISCLCTEFKLDNLRYLEQLSAK